MLIWLLSPAVGLLALLLLDRIERRLLSSVAPDRQRLDAFGPARGAPLPPTPLPLQGSGHRRGEAVDGHDEPSDRPRRGPQRAYPSGRSRTRFPVGRLHPSAMRQRLARHAGNHPDARSAQGV